MLKNGEHISHGQPIGWMYRCKGPDWQIAGLPRPASSTKWIDISGKLKTNSYICKNLLLLVSTAEEYYTFKHFFLKGRLGYGTTLDWHQESV